MGMSNLQDLPSFALMYCVLSFEQVKRWHLAPEAFHESLLTPTLKIKRNIAKEYYKDIIAKLYDEPVGRPSKL